LYLPSGGLPDEFRWDVWETGSYTWVVKQRGARCISGEFYGKSEAYAKYTRAIAEECSWQVTATIQTKMLTL